jgi:hypothetical protein
MAKSPSRRGAVAPARVKTSVTISPESFQRLGAACIKEGWTQSEVVEWMIGRLLSGYCVQVRGDRIGHPAPPVSSGHSIDRPSGADEVSPAAPLAA